MLPRGALMLLLTPTGPTTLVQDNFNTAANGTVLSGETPATGPVPGLASGVAAAELKINNGTAVPNGTKAGDLYGALGQSDVTIVSNVTFQTGHDTGHLGRFFNQSGSNGWYCCFDANANAL